MDAWSGYHISLHRNRACAIPSSAKPRKVTWPFIRSSVLLESWGTIDRERSPSCYPLTRKFAGEELSHGKNFFRRAAGWISVERWRLGSGHDPFATCSRPGRPSAPPANRRGRQRYPPPWARMPSAGTPLSFGRRHLMLPAAGNRGQAGRCPLAATAPAAIRWEAWTASAQLRLPALASGIVQAVLTGLLAHHPLLSSGTARDTTWPA